VRRRIGSGGQADDVYEVHDENEDDVVALKLLNPSGIPLGPWHEARLLRQLTDHHILPIRNAATTLGQNFLVTELATHGTVADRVRAAGQAGVGQDAAIRWTRQACQGIARAHDAGLTHNDIKPANLFLDEREDCMVGDFGCAGLLDPQTGTAPVHGGSAETMPREIAAAWTSNPLATPQSDVFSLAASMFWMLTGRPVYDFAGTHTPAERLNVVIHAVPPRLRDIAPHVPDPIARVVDRALAVDPGERPPTAHDFAADLGRRISGRRWRRTDEHPAHIACWRGTPERTGSEYLMCMSQGARPSERVISTVHARSGNRIRAGEASASPGSWARVVRRLMKALG
jgi:serine/threonine protein kinase